METHRLTRALVVLVCSSLAVPGCATATRRGSLAINTPQAGINSRAVLAEYVQKLPAGSAIRVERVSGRTQRGTLMKATDQVVVLQPKTRIPEPPVEIPIDDVLSVTPEQASGTNVAKAIGIGAAAGAGAALAVFFVILASLSD